MPTDTEYDMNICGVKRTLFAAYLVSSVILWVTTPVLANSMMLAVESPDQLPVTLGALVIYVGALTAAMSIGIKIGRSQRSSRAVYEQLRAEIEELKQQIADRNDRDDSERPSGSPRRR